MARIFGAGIDSRARSRRNGFAFIGSILEGLIAAMERPLLNNACIEVALRRPVRQPEACSKSARIRLSERVKLTRQRTLD